MTTGSYIELIVLSKLTGDNLTDDISLILNEYFFLTDFTQTKEHYIENDMMFLKIYLYDEIYSINRTNGCLDIGECIKQYVLYRYDLKVKRVLFEA
jgi:hypothetical protein